MTITRWRTDQPAPSSARRAPLTEQARAHGWHPCTNGCVEEFRCPSCGHYRRDATPTLGYRCNRCIGTEHLITYLALAFNTGIGTAEAVA